jgi:hypothetical protein
VWASLALDYLAIMASSVSSERAFSAGGITLSRRRNRLKGDIVEALQVLKCAIRKELLVRPPMPSSMFEQDIGDDDDIVTKLDSEVESEETYLEVVVSSDDENDSSL